MSTSSPPTPPSRALIDGELRFKTITLPCEWVEDYRPGGYHPVVLGDVFNRQYKVIRKLGEGSYSTVWLARDLENSGYVALKILVSEISGSTTELRILRHIIEVAPVEGTRYITRLLGEFEHRGPNGVHKCLVFEPMGPSVNTMVEELPQFKPRRREMKIRYPLQMAKSILKQSLQALVFLHENGIAHGDFQPGNILFTLNDIDSTPEDLLRQEEDVQSRSISPPVQRLDGKQDGWAPRYLCVAQPLVPFTCYAEGFKVKLSDMGGAYFFTDPPAKPVTPLGLRAPEFILTGAVDNTVDIWSFGCLVFELITGQPLFCIPSSEMEDDDHLLSLTAQLGALPDELYKHWTTSSLYFTPERKLFNCQLGGVAPGEEPLMVEQTSMEESFDRTGLDLDEEEAHKVKALIRWILQYDPAKRPSPAKILADPWFCEIDVESDSSRASIV
ncbi:hypothetical protein DTO013E5_10067 [Penicillium roqueforti]|uniref:uncharacterized protein n=1 Tax=Penicillium roqueforti TaxID=5082 RepID=UPI00190A0BCB|nr:uncharacterized protein LCP9604111_8266 [Penicillium roqueforti]KAF9241657.1 hypothetical protein LCP9604111_8266 [Penicillium roqueforti]KAI2669571.1 hypothetical protein LCP963914a_9916 [Penicillium roqueforti]KAI2672930.1 hypothetical protein CBS147355_7733 [Penicillium roqueforti]KAI2703170.1 hypothetical protein CBS147372_3485 [Penicillium roqueforti]KAI2703483.1 hypothetical protein CBS147332_7469 [Penicillium roqueforti]